MALSVNYNAARTASQLVGSQRLQWFDRVWAWFTAAAAAAAAGGGGDGDVS